MNKHQHINQLLATYRDLSKSEKEMVDEHLKICSTCAEKLADYQTIDRALNRLREQDLSRLPISLNPTFSSPIVRTDAGSPQGHQGGHFWKYLPTLFGQLVGLVALLFLVIYLVMLLGGSRRNHPAAVDLQDASVATSQPIAAQYFENQPQQQTEQTQFEITPIPKPAATQQGEPSKGNSVPPLTRTTVISFDYGIHVAATTNLNLQIEQLKKLGVGWVILDMPWATIETRQNEYDWGEWDERINAYNEAGFNILMRISAAPNWARPTDDDKSVRGMPKDPQTIAMFVTLLTGRYHGKIQAIEIWQEQNLYYAVGGQGRVNVDDYMALLTIAYQAIKASDPNIVVISGGLTPISGSQPYGVDDVIYLEQMYERGLKGVSDAVGAHPPGFINPPDALFLGSDDNLARGYDDHRSFFFRNTMEAYREIMLKHDDGNRMIVPTEFGWPVFRYDASDSRFVFAQENSLEEQAAYIVRAYEMGRDWGWVGPMFLFNLDYALVQPDSALSNFSILSKDGPTPAYEQLQAVITAQDKE